MIREQYLKNKERFINIIKSIKRSGMDIEGLIHKLENSDFFFAPASTKYHNSYEGGLCEHSLNVFDNMMMLCLNSSLHIDEDSIKIVALLHDISKMNFYETTVINKKVYSDNGSKYDELGKYDWKSVKGYKVKEVENRFVFGSSEQTSDFIISYFVPMTVEEHSAILNITGGTGYNCSNLDVSPIYSTYPLAVLLHCADMMASYLPNEAMKKSEDKINQKPEIMDSENV